MKLQEFQVRFGSLGQEAFHAHFPHPFLLEEGRLDLEEGDSERQVFLLRSKAAIKIGRSASADIRLRHHQMSSRHALLFAPDEEGGLWRLMDANSTNGTFIDGRKAASGDKIPVPFGSLIRFGLETRLMLLDSKGLLKALRKLEKRTGGEPAARHNPSLSASTRHDLKVISQATLEGEEDDDDLAQELSQDLLLVCDPYDPVPLREGDAFVVGRTPSAADVVLPHGNVSRRHCLIERRDDGVYVKDLGSANGSYICGVRVGSAPMLFLPGKPLEVGPFELRLEGDGLLEPDPSKTQSVSANQGTTVLGKLELTPLVDLLQAIENEEKTGCLEVEGSSGLSGLITFRQGAPHNARTSDNKWGAEAVRHLLTLERGGFVIDRDETKVGDKSITLTFGEILLDDFLRETEEP